MPVSIRIVPEERWAAAAAEPLDELLARHPGALVSFPTGSTPLPLYAELTRAAAASPGRFSRLRAVMLDDYLGAAALPSNFHQWLRRHLLDGLRLGDDRLLRIPTEAGAPEAMAAACAAFERRLADWGGCDLQYLGLGGNGHIGFNDPGSPASSRTRVVELAAETARANAAYWNNGYVPSRAVTMGLATILEARQICLLVRGAAKADMLRQALHGPIGPDVPASFLQGAASLIVIADIAAAARL